MAAPGQTINDRLNAVRYALAGQGLARTVCKATTLEVLGPKKKHIDYLIACTNEPNVSTPQLANLLIERTQHSNWAAVFKSLITIHHLMSYGNERFTQYLATSNHSFELADFMDRTTPQGYNMSAFVRRYAKYINDKSISYRTLAIDLCKIRSGNDNALRTMNMDNLSKTLPIVQAQFDSLLEFGAEPKDLNNGVILAAFRLLYKDLVRLYVAYQEAIINLLERYFKLSRKKTREALELYRKYLARMNKVAGFLTVVDAVGLDKSEMPDLTNSPASILKLLEQHLAQLEAKKHGGAAAASPELDQTGEDEDQATVDTTKTTEEEVKLTTSESEQVPSEEVEPKPKQQPQAAEASEPPKPAPPVSVSTPEPVEKPAPPQKPARPSPKASPKVSPASQKPAPKGPSGAAPPTSASSPVPPPHPPPPPATVAATAAEKKGPPERPAKPPSRPPPPSAASGGPNASSSSSSTSTVCAGPATAEPAASHDEPPAPTQAKVATSPTPPPPPPPPPPSSHPQPQATTTSSPVAASTTDVEAPNGVPATAQPDSIADQQDAGSANTNGQAELPSDGVPDAPSCSATIINSEPVEAEDPATTSEGNHSDAIGSGGETNEQETNHVNNNGTSCQVVAAEDEIVPPPPPPPIDDNEFENIQQQEPGNENSVVNGQSSHEAE